jgi:hypothetical protein
MASRYAVALMALLGSAAAQQGFNSSTSASTTSSAAVPVYTTGSEPTVGGVTYLIQTDTSYQGQILQLARKRQSDASIQSCLSTCSADVDCQGTAFVQDTGSCLYYSSVDTATAADSPGTDFALVQERASSTTTSAVFNGTTSAGTSSTGVALPSGGSGNSTTSATRSAGVTGGAGNNSTTARPTGSASVTGGTGNSTRSTGSASRTSSGVSTTTSGAAVPSTPSTLLTINGVLFLIEIDISKRGVSINFALIFAKRAGQSLDDCLTTCAANSNCAATSFTESDGVCSFYTSVEAGSETVDDDSTFATVISRAGAVGSGANNGTSGGNTTTPIPSNATAESFICPAFNAAVLRSSLNVTFSISCSSFLIGTTFDIVPSLSKRQTFDNGLPQTLSNCVDLCSLSEECVGATFDIARSTCTYYSSIAYSTRLDGFDSAVRVQDNSNDGGEVITTTVAGQVTTLTVPGATTTQYVAGQTSTATVYSTITSTVYANGAGATAFPSGAVVTEVVSVSTITYVNTVSTITVPQNQNAAATVTVTVGGGSGSGSGSNAPVVTQTVYQTVDQAGNVIGSSTANAVAGGAAGNGGMYPTVTVFAACSTPAAQQDTTVWTTVYV